MAVFEHYVEEVLAPHLQAGQIVIKDNLSCHKGNQVRQLIEARECQLLCLPVPRSFTAREVGTKALVTRRCGDPYKALRTSRSASNCNEGEAATV